MITGSRIVAPEGYKGLSKNHTYYFLQNDAACNRVRFVLFTEAGGEICARLITMSSVEFESAIDNEEVVELEDGEIYPPWLTPIQGVSISQLEDRRIHTKESYLEKVDRRYLAIAELVPRAREILGMNDPGAEIGAYARSQKMNANRVRLWFYTYLVFGRNKWALMPRLHKIGRWDRDEKASPHKLGRPSAAGKKAGHPTTPEMKAGILTGYQANKSKYKTMAEIYRKTLTNVFGCISTGEEWIHPEGKPFPSYGQFRRWVILQTKRSSRAVEEKGPSKARAQSGDVGSFSERLLVVNQRAEFDGYYVSEKLSGLTEDSAVDGFCVVRSVCDLSGQITGIGFANSRETMEAYRMCLFSQAVGKVKYGELFGCPISPGEWPCEGLASDMIVDRGPAAGFDCLPEIRWLGALELPPSYSGQGKASIESSHPRDKKFNDKPAYFHSSHNFVEMAKREILQVLKDNHGSDASGRMTEDLTIAGVKPTPQGIWNYYHNVGRDLSVYMQFDEAVRTFLTPQPVTIRKDAVYLYGRKYRSEALMDTGVFDRVARKGVIHAEAYVLNMCVRHIWIELENELFELSFVLPMRALEGSGDVTLEELKFIDELRRNSNSVQSEKKLASDQLYEDRFTEITGKEWGEGKWVEGQARKDAATTRDGADYARFLGRKK